jgi:trans-aconitate methyltransferase
MIQRIKNRLKRRIRRQGKAKGGLHFAREVAPSPHMKPIYDWVLEASKADSTSKVFDEGCGSGMLYRHARSRYGRKPFRNYFGIDSNMDVVREAQKHGVISVHNDFAGGLPDVLRPEALLNNFTHYYAILPTNDVRENAIKAAESMLMKGGRYVILAPDKKEERRHHEMLTDKLKLESTEHRDLTPEQIEVLSDHEPLDSMDWRQGLRLSVFKKVK